ncbi:MAG: Rne/Rng family ribonuclease [Pseudomonadota bacterium]
MAKKMLIDATHAEETRVVVVDGNRVEEFDFESENKRQLAGNIYLAKVTRVEPSLQAAFVDYGGNRHGFLAFSEIHPDYYQIPVADREALLAEEAEIARAEADEDEAPKKRRSSRSRSRSKAAKTDSADAVATQEATPEPGSDISGMDVVETDTTDGASDLVVELPEGDAASQEPSPVEADTGKTGDEESADAPAEDAAPSEQPDQPSDDDTPDDAPEMADAAARDTSIESVADDDVSEEIRAPRKQRARRYKIQEVIKVRQILLVQVVKEERGNKGAALTTYLSLAGRYCVLMPNTARGGGISRKITNAADRKKLKEIAGEIDVPKGAGLIVRTAGAKRTKTEIKRDYEYLQRLWEQIRELTLKSIAPAKIYEEGDLIKRSIRDLYNREIDEVFVEGADGYRVAKDFMKMIMPSHAKNVKQYAEIMPLFARFQVESYLSSMFNPTVQLKSGGYIVIGVTEALVAVDVNSGRATKEGSIEETALKTNLEASDEVARQLRLRDLAGLIVIDYIDMDERKNNAAVEKRLKDKLKTDRARIQVGRISGFGLMEMSRQRLRPGMLEASTQPCPSCHGTGLIRSEDSLGLTILRQIEEEGTRKRSREVLLKAPVAIANFLMNQKREHIANIEARYGMAVRIEADPFLISPDFSIEKFKTATRTVTAQPAVISAESSFMADVVEEDTEEEDAVAAEAEVETEDKPKKKRRRRRRRRGGSGGDAQGAEGQGGESQSGEAPQNGAHAGENPEVDPEASGDAVAAADPSAGEAAAAETPEAVEDAPKPKKTTRTRSRSRSRSKKTADQAAPEPTVDASAQQAAELPPQDAPAPETKAATAPAPEAAVAPLEQAVKRTRTSSRSKPKTDTVVEPVAEVMSPEPEAAATEDDKPKRRGWWSIGR